jgi:type I restriction enzyme S subunit
MSQVELTTLGKSCEFFNGKAHEKSIDENGKYIVVNSKFISSEGKSFKRTNEQMFPLYKGDIVMVMSDVPNGKALAKCFIIDKDDTYSLNQRICCIRSKEFDTKYLYYQLNRHEHFLAFNNGENQTNLRKDDILACPLIKPSMEEQKRMVDELDRISNDISRAILNTNQNANNAKELFQSKLSEYFSIKKENWNTKRLKDLIVYDKTPNKRKNLPYVGLEHIESNTGKFIGTLQPFEVKSSTFYFNENHVLYGRLRPYLNKVILPTFEGHCSTEIFPIKVSKEITRDFLFFWLITLSTVEKIDSTWTGARMPRANMNKVLEFEFQFPDLETQKEIVNELRFLANESAKLEEIYTSKSLGLEELKAGVLKRAFENELIEAE